MEASAALSQETRWSQSLGRGRIRRNTGKIYLSPGFQEPSAGSLRINAWAELWFGSGFAEL